jgi:hypothetical protein
LSITSTTHHLVNCQRPPPPTTRVPHCLHHHSNPDIQSLLSNQIRMEPVYSTPLGCINKALVFSRTGAHEQHKTPALVTYTNIRTRAMRTKLRSAVLIGSILLAFLSAPLVTSTSVETKASRYLKGEQSRILCAHHAGLLERDYS